MWTVQCRSRGLGLRCGWSLLTRCLASPRSINRYRWTVRESWRNAWELASHPGGVDALPHWNCNKLWLDEPIGLRADFTLFYLSWTICKHLFILLSGWNQFDCTLPCPSTQHRDLVRTCTTDSPMQSLVY